jgi:Rap guanine nucleotide exchange factor 2
MLALREFGITELSSNYSLYEVTVKVIIQSTNDQLKKIDQNSSFYCVVFFQNGSVMQKRQPDDQTNLAERIGLSSRYYIKNIMSSDQLIPEDAKAELAKDSIVHLLQLYPMEAATQLMVEDFTIFRQIEMTEYVDNLFELETIYGTPNLDRFGELVNHEMMWVITEIVSEPNMARRVKIMKQFIKVRNLHSTTN